MANLAINLRNINKFYQDFQALKDISLEIKSGNIVGLVGKNGVGKTTLLKSMLGLINVDSGSAEIYDSAVNDMNNEIRSRIGYVPQSFTGFRWFKGKDLIDFTASFYDEWNKEKVMNLSEQWELKLNNKVEDLSIGERQKLSILLAIGHNPDLLILDEPVASLDPIARRDFIRELIDYNIDENKTIIFSTHITSDLERIAADIIFMKSGEINYYGELSELKESIVRVKIKSENNISEELPFNNVIRKELDSNSALLTIKNPDISAIENYKIESGNSVTVENLNLEELFLELNK